MAPALQVAKRQYTNAHTRVYISLNWDNEQASSKFPENHKVVRSPEGVARKAQWRSEPVEGPEANHAGR